MIKPNFLIVGAPKCGTTTLYSNLLKHPDIFLSPIKEPHFFGSDLSYSEFRQKANKYADLFGKTDKKVVGEASTWYLYSKTAASEIRAYNPQMKIIIMLRNPVNAAFSLHSQALFSRNEVLSNFDDALNVEELRLKGKAIPVCAHRTEALHYTEAYKYSQQISRFAANFKSSQILVIIFEEFINMPHKIMVDVCEFLGVDSKFQFQVGISNSRKKIRNHFIHKMIQKKNKRLTKLFPIIIRRQMHNLLKQLNSRKAESYELSESVRNKLQETFIKDIEKTEAILNLKLDDWKY
ncbi:MAG: sulfotransferase [Cyclobacteriaceae bacterium]